MRALRPAVMRWPGGCFADGYHWQDGIGPRDKRPRRRNRAWAKLGSKLGPEENNRFGTDELLRLCEEIGAEPQLTVNVGSGSVEEAAAWVEYVNGPLDSKWGAERARNGHPEPYNVKYWFIGNEILGFYEIGHLKPAKYAQTFRQFALAMRKVDPRTKLIASGTYAPNKDHEEIHKAILQGAGEHIDYLSIHLYAILPFLPRNIMRYQVLNQQRSP